jgi:hypothetical protein
MVGGLAGLLMDAVKPGRVNIDNAESISMDDFLSNIVPKCSSIELLVENKHLTNFMSVTAPINDVPAGLFKWDNNFAWSYDGDFADSIKERVKKAGGSVEGDICCRLAWDYSDDLDLHMREPDKFNIYFSNRRKLSPNGGMLDVDANGCDGTVDEPVENIFYKHKKNMRYGKYSLAVHNYSRRSNGIGFEVEVEIEGKTINFVYDKVIRSNEMIPIAEISYDKVRGITIEGHLPSSASGKEKWGITTQTLVPVDVLMASPNHWDEQNIGHKHWFFILRDCVNEGQARGIYNEFLNSSLEEHRKVFEVIGAKTKCETSAEQMSGIGFSATKCDEATVVVKGPSINKAYKIAF